MDKSTELKVRKLSQNQAKALKAIIFPNNQNFGTAIPGSYISLATGLKHNALGGTVSALTRNEIISPLGKEDRQYNWELTDPDLIQAKNEDPETLLEMLKKIGGEK